MWEYQFEDQGWTGFSRAVLIYTVYLCANFYCSLEGISNQGNSPYRCCDRALTQVVSRVIFYDSPGGMCPDRCTNLVVRISDFPCVWQSIWQSLLAVLLRVWSPLPCYSWHTCIHTDTSLHVPSHHTTAMHAVNRRDLLLSIVPYLSPAPTSLRKASSLDFSAIKGLPVETSWSMLYECGWLP